MKAGKALARTRLTDCFLPRICSFCNRKIEDGSFPPGICRRCSADMPLRPPGHVRHFLFPKEMQEGERPLALYLSFYYEAAVRKAVTGLKFHGRMDYAESLGALAALVWQRVSIEELSCRNELASVEMIIPLPLHKKRLRERGYNQAALAAESMARYLNLPCRADLLTRPKPTSRQSETRDRMSRIKNVSGAFACPEPEKLCGRHVLLLDDVASSGASLWAGAGPLLSAGAEVTLWALAGNQKSEDVRF